MHAPIRRLLSEPLFHFLALGAGLFALHGLVGSPGPGGASKAIRITDGDVQRISAAWQLRWRRPPTEPELAKLIAEHIREEVLYREALALGLDRDDSIVRRRLAQKMEFLAMDATAVEPSERELRRLFDSQPDRFERPARLTFEHLYFSPERRRGAVHDDVERALDQLRAGASARGDPFMLQRRYADATAQQIAAELGRQFADALLDFPVGSWQGPLKSSYGLHLVRLETRTDPRPASFAEATDAVRAAWHERRRREADQAMFERLRNEYAIENDTSLPGQLIGASQ